MTDTRHHAHQLIDCMPEVQLAGLVQFLETIVNPSLRHIPLEDEEISEDEERAVAEAQEWLKHNKPIPHEQLLTELGLTISDWESMRSNPVPSEDSGR